MALTAPQAEEIRKLRASRVRPREIAELVGVSLRTVHGVLGGHITGRQLTPREQFEEDGRTGWAPLCMDADEWADWRARTSFTGLTFAEQAGRPCADCPLGFAADMRAEGRCNGTPGGVVEDADQVEEEETVMDHVATPVAPAGRPVDVTLAVPCGTCIHSGICRHEPELAGLTQLRTQLPVLDRALSVQLTAAVSCGHYAKAKAPKPAAAPKPASAGDRDERRARILAAVERHGGDVSAAAAELGELPHVVARIRNAAQSREVAS